MTNLTNSTIRVNHSNRTITITKTFNKLASIYGSDEYMALRGAKLDNPGYRVVVKSPAKKKIEDRITMKDIVAYVEAKSGAESEEMKKLIDLRGYYRVTGRHPGYKVFNPEDEMLHKKD